MPNSRDSPKIRRAAAPTLAMSALPCSVRTRSTAPENDPISSP